MPKKTGLRYPEEFKAEAVQLARSSPKRSIRRLAYELGIGDQTLRNWIRQAEFDHGEREGLTTEEHEELRRLRKENKILREVREILKKLQPSSQRKTGPGEHPQAHRGGEGYSLCPNAVQAPAVQAPGRLSQRLLCLEAPTALRESSLRRGTLGEDRDDPPQQPGRLRSAERARRTALHRHPLRQEAGRARLIRRRS
jgi:transposase